MSGNPEGVEMSNMTPRELLCEAVIVSVWLDKTDVADPVYIVDEDRADGGESETIEIFPGTAEGRSEAIAFATRAAAGRGCELRVSADSDES